MCLKYFRYVPWASLFALIITIVGSVMFIILFDNALKGFAGQLNVLVPVGTFLKFRWLLIGVTLCIILIAIGFLFVGAAATSVSVRYHTRRDIPDKRSFLIRAITSPCILGLLSLVLSILVIFWCVIVSISAVFASFYIVFITSIYSFCNMVDNQCFDFTVLLPAIINQISNKKVDLKFCKDKKEALCAMENNQFWSFIGALSFCFLTLTGLVYFLMCMSANYTRIRSERRAYKGEHLAMNQGTVDSNSFILTNMGK
ncbi:unnamed protein product [Cercopithifilaria johnstoni]|uniref:Uncharacterized protein n=1 Tax=Cercopithifilaria johnstoni TaxID=2874296 RepID=A0A8J2PUB1_9BILA|nr:unnamed protein product [Cercopithifilaria johnstoni]